MGRALIAFFSNRSFDHKSNNLSGFSPKNDKTIDEPVMKNNLLQTSNKTDNKSPASNDTVKKKVNDTRNKSASPVQQSSIIMNEEKIKVYFNFVLLFLYFF